MLLLTQGPFQYIKNFLIRVNVFKISYCIKFGFYSFPTAKYHELR